MYFLNFFALNLFFCSCFCLTLTSDLLCFCFVGFGCSETFFRSFLLPVLAVFFVLYLNFLNFGFLIAISFSFCLAGCFWDALLAFFGGLFFCFLIKTFFFGCFIYFSCFSYFPRVFLYSLKTNPSSSELGWEDCCSGFS